MDTNGTTNKYFLPGAVIVAGLLIAGAVMWNGSRPAVPGQVAGPSGAAPSVNVKNIKTDGNPYIGQKNAPITMVFWSDFQCPFCRAVEVGGVPQIPTAPAIPDVIKNYVDTGKLKIVFMDFAFLGSDSTTAALYGRSVWKLYPNAYMEWRTAMYTAQDEEQDIGFGDTASIDKLNATIPGIDAVKIAADVKANTSVYQALVDADKAEAQKVGVGATPSFIVGTQLIAGAYPFEKFKEVIDPFLK